MFWAGMSKPFWKDWIEQPQGNGMVNQGVSCASSGVACLAPFLCPSMADDYNWDSLFLWPPPALGRGREG